MNLFTLMAKIGIDDSEYKKGVSNTVDSGKGLANKMGGFMGNAASVTGKGLAILAKGTAVAIGAVSTAIGVLGKIGFEYNADMEMYTSNFKVMLGSQEAAVKKVAELKEFAAKTPFGMQDLAESTKTLLAFQVPAEQASDTLKMLGDISLGNSEKLKSLSLVFGQVSSAGRLTGQDLLQFINQGFNPLNEIAKTTGESMEELRDRMSKGGVSVDEVTAALISATSAGGQFYNGMDEAAKTTQGLISTLKDDTQALVGEVFIPMSEGLLQNVLPSAINAIESLSTAFKEKGIDGMITAAGEIIVNTLTTFANSLPQFIQYAVDIVISIVNNLNSNTPAIVDATIKIAGALIKGLGTALPKVLEFAINFILQLTGKLIGLIPDILKSGVEIGTNIVQGIWNGIKSGWSWLINGVKDLANQLFGAVKNVLQIKSPSRKFMYLGEMSAEGMGVGFDNKFADVKKKITNQLDFSGVSSNIDINTQDKQGNNLIGKAVTVVQNIYAQAQTAADLMQESLYLQERAVILGV